MTMEAGPGHLTDTFVGRTEELAQLRDCAGRAGQGAAWLALIEGEPGIGKTYLARQAVATVLSGFQVLSANCDQSETELPYGLISQLVARIPAALRREHPTVTGHLPDSTAPFLVGAQLLALLGRLQDGGPVAVVVDDLQWADRESVLALGFVLRRLWADRVLTLLLARSGPLAYPPGSSIAEDVRRLVDNAAHARELRLSGFGEPEIRTLGTRLGLPRWTTRAAGELHRKTGGHPLYVRMLLTERPEASSGAHTALPVPDRLANTVRRQVAELPEQSSRLLSALSVLNTRCPLAMAGRAAGVASPADALGPLVDNGFVTWWPSEPSTPVQLRHQLQREAIYQQLTPGRRRELHAAAVPLVDPAAALGHRVAASDGFDAGLAAELEAAAAELIPLGEIGQAVTYLLWAADLSPERAERERLTLSGATHLLLAEHFARAQAIRPAVERCGPSVLRDCLLGRYVLVDGSLPQAEERLGAVLAAAHGRPELDWEAALAGHWLASLYTWMGQGERSIPIASIPLASGMLEDYATEQTRYFVCTGRLYLDSPQAALRELSWLPPATEVSATNAYLLCWRGAFRMLAGELSEAMVDLTVGLRLAPVSAAPEVSITAHFFLAQTQALLGAWPEAAINAELAVTIGEVDEDVWAHAATHGTAARLAAARGEADKAAEHLAAAEHWYGMVGPEQYAVYPAMAAAAIAQAGADWPGVLEASERILRLPRDGWRRVYRHIWEPQYVEALIATGELSAAGSALAELRELAERAPQVRTVTSWLTAWLAHRSGDVDAALRSYTDTPVPAADDPPLYRARLEHGHGLLLRDLGQRRAAIDTLRRAAETYRTLGARPFLERCVADLAGCGLTVSIQESGARAELTDRERAIVHLVAKGHSNQQVSGELYISVKTVEYHLSNIYTKLGVRSRRELTRLFA